MERRTAPKQVLSIKVTPGLYQRLKKEVGSGKVSRFVENVVNRELDEQVRKAAQIQKEFQQKLACGYQAMAKNKKLKEDNNNQNENDEEVIVSPLTTEEVIAGEVQFFEIPVMANKETGLDEPSRVLLNRIHTVDKELRLIERLGRVDEKV
ncbi:16478_t:CDS:2 [Entrophospora sp. SA101]|nr:16478_t:CDS:2 [Entrophospora sp. SA101]CAJ0912298.1 9085_t:CDS:2 [Entrophospora sp. SA101]